MPHVRQHTRASLRLLVLVRLTSVAENYSFTSQHISQPSSLKLALDISTIALIDRRKALSFGTYQTFFCI